MPSLLQRTVKWRWRIDDGGGLTQGWSKGALRPTDAMEALKSLLTEDRLTQRWSHSILELAQRRNLHA